MDAVWVGVDGEYASLAVLIIGRLVEAVGAMRVDIIHRHLSFALIVAVGHSKLGRVVSDRLCTIVHLRLEVLQAERER